MRALRTQNEDLVRRVENLSARVEVMAARMAQPPSPAPAAEAQRPPESVTNLVPPDLAVVKVQPWAKAQRTPPPVATAVPLVEPDPGRLDALTQQGGREIAAEAESALRAARRRSGLDRAHALEDFAASFPHHPQADNALVESAQAYADAGKDDASCALARRVAEEYPAGDAMSDALERLAWCESRRGAADAERRLLERLVSEYPRSPAAARAGKRLAAISGRAGENPPAARPARSSP